MVELVAQVGRDDGADEEECGGHGIKPPAENTNLSLGVRSVRIESECRLTFCWRMIYSENLFPSPIGVEDMLFGIVR